MRNSSPRERPYLFGWSFGIETAAWALGASCGGFVVTWLESLTGSVIWGYRLMLLGGVGLLLLAALPYALVRETGVAEEDRRPLSHFLVARDWALLGKLTLPTMIVGAGAGFVIPFLNLYFRDRFAIEVESIGLFFAGASALMTVGNFVGPWIAKRMGLLMTVACSQLLSIPFMLILAFTTNLPLAVAAFLLRSALMNMGHPMARNFAMEVVREDEQAVTNSGESLGWNGGWMLSTVVGGQVIEAHGYLPSFLITTTLYLISTALYLVFFRTRSYRRIGIDEK
jgi:predicted MFS family arabinose efflux permease